MSKIDNYTAFEAIKNVMPENRLADLFTVCPNLNKERVELTKAIDQEARKAKQAKGDDDLPSEEVESPNNKTKPSLFQRLFSCCSVKENRIA